MKRQSEMWQNIKVPKRQISGVIHEKVINVVNDFIDRCIWVWCVRAKVCSMTYVILYTHVWLFLLIWLFRLLPRRWIYDKKNLIWSFHCRIPTRGIGASTGSTAFGIRLSALQIFKSGIRASTKFRTLFFSFSGCGPFPPWNS